MLCKGAIETSTLELLLKLQEATLLNDFFLAGGTSLAMQIEHRKSIDLDLFTTNDFDSNKLLEFLEENFGFRLDYSEKNKLKGSINNVKIDFISHKYPLVKTPVNLLKAKILSIADIAAMKLNAIAGNGTRSKDFIDIYFILKQFSVQEIINFYNIKYKTRNSLHVIKSLNYFDDISTQDWPDMILEKNLSLTKVKQSIEKNIAIFFNQLK
ncbi:MAG TPA: hypothetical protein DCG75_10210 [Bacteroidales bacterium]|nr:hypothetical protein [Bacteroidales bacterium]